MDLQFSPNYRWYVDVRSWTDERSEKLLPFLSEEEHKKVMSFKFSRDRNMALASRLLQKLLIHKVYKLNVEDIVIARTTEDKPFFDHENFVSTGRLTSSSSPLSFNVSHHREFVVLVSRGSPSAVGIDLVDLEEPPRGCKSLEDFFSAFMYQFTSQEWEVIRGPSTEQEKLKRFYCNWALKEAYIKAIGVGLGMDLRRISFEIVEPKIVIATLDNRPLGDWRFELVNLNAAMLVAIAYGPSCTERETRPHDHTRRLNPESETPESNAFADISFEQLYNLFTS